MSTKPITLGHLKKRKQRSTRSIRIATDQKVEETFREAKQALELAKGRERRYPTDPDVAAAYKTLSAEYAEAEREMAKHSIKFTFQSIGYKPYDQLVEAHLMNKERLDQLISEGKLSKDQAEEATWDPETFPVALLVASMTEPDIEDKEALLEWITSDDWNISEVQALFEAATIANMSSRVVELGNV